MRITLCDVGPRDGLQNDPVQLEPAVRAELVDRLSETGLPRIETTSFVNPKAVPRMAGAAEVMGAITRKPGVIYAALVLNGRGLDDAIAADADEIHVAYPLTNTFCRKNQNVTLDEATTIAGQLVTGAKAAGKRVTMTLGVSFGCPFEGPVDPGLVVEHARLGQQFRFHRLQEAGRHHLRGAQFADIAFGAQERDVLHRQHPQQ